MITQSGISQERAQQQKAIPDKLVPFFGSSWPRQTTLKASSTAELLTQTALSKSPNIKQQIFWALVIEKPIESHNDRSERSSTAKLSALSFENHYYFLLYSNLDSYEYPCQHLIVIGSQRSKRPKHLLQ